MFLQFFANLRQAHVPATLREHLDLMRALEADLAQMSIDEFYRLARALLTRDLINFYRRDYRVVFVGDASMSPHEIMSPGGSVEHLNPEPGRVWLERATLAWPRIVWINPTPRSAWNHSLSTTMIAEIFRHRMYPLTPDGVEAAMRALAA